MISNLAFEAIKWFKLEFKILHNNRTNTHSWVQDHNMWFFFLCHTVLKYSDNTTDIFIIISSTVVSFTGWIIEKQASSQRYKMSGHQRWDCLRTYKFYAYTMPDFITDQTKLLSHRKSTSSHKNTVNYLFKIFSGTHLYPLSVYKSQL